MIWVKICFVLVDRKRHLIKNVMNGITLLARTRSCMKERERKKIKENKKKEKN